MNSKTKLGLLAILADFGLGDEKMSMSQLKNLTSLNFIRYKRNKHKNAPFSSNKTKLEKAHFGTFSPCKPFLGRSLK